MNGKFTNWIKGQFTIEGLAIVVTLIVFITRLDSRINNLEQSQSTTDDKLSKLTSTLVAVVQNEAVLATLVSERTHGPVNLESPK